MFHRWRNVATSVAGVVLPACRFSTYKAMHGTSISVINIHDALNVILHAVISGERLIFLSH